MGGNESENKLKTMRVRCIGSRMKLPRLANRKCDAVTQSVLVETTQNFGSSLFGSGLGALAVTGCD